MVSSLQLNKQSLIGGLHRIPEGSMACLDTTVRVDLIRLPNRKEHQNAANLIREMLDQGETLSTARACEAELYVGVHLSTQTNLERERVEQLLSLFVILEFNTAVAEQFGRVKAHLIKSGRITGDMDILIAATCLANGEPTLATRNPRHFADIPGLQIQKY